MNITITLKKKKNKINNINTLLKKEINFKYTIKIKIKK